MSHLSSWLRAQPRRLANRSRRHWRLEALEDRSLPSTTLAPEPSGGVAGPAGHVVEFRKGPAGFISDTGDSLASADSLFALALVDRLLVDWPDNTVLLVKRAQLIQLQESEDGPSLEEARAMLERAADLDDVRAAAAARAASGRIRAVRMDLRFFDLGLARPRHFLACLSRFCGCSGMFRATEPGCTQNRACRRSWNI